MVFVTDQQRMHKQSNGVLQHTVCIQFTVTGKGLCTQCTCFETELTPNHHVYNIEDDQDIENCLEIGFLSVCYLDPV